MEPKSRKAEGHIPDCTIHVWVHRPEAGGALVQRFECWRCHAWAHAVAMRLGKQALTPVRSTAEPSPPWFASRVPDDDRGCDVLQWAHDHGG
jgi:hypothetical protein